MLSEIKKLNKEERLIKPFYNILKKIENQVSFFEEDNHVKNTLECAKLCVNWSIPTSIYIFTKHYKLLLYKSRVDWRDLGDRRKVRK